MFAPSNLEQSAQDQIPSISRSPHVPISGLLLLTGAFTVFGALYVNAHSVLSLIYYFFLWHTWILVFHRGQLWDFGCAFTINSAFITAYYLIQTSVYPESYGATSLLGASTDDSYFFSILADSIPPKLLLRDYYFESTSVFPKIVRALTPLRIDHPMDVIFFQSGTTALLATFSKRFMLQLSNNVRLGQTAFVLALICPFLMMNGGVVFIRDTLAAALLIYSLSCIESARYSLALLAVSVQFAVRPGTAFILVPVYGVIYFRPLLLFVSRHRLISASVLLAAIVGVVSIAVNPPELPAIFAGTSEGGAVTWLGRDLISGLTTDPNGNAVFLWIQEFPFVVKFVLNGCYMFLYPFLSLRNAFPDQFFDVRAMVLNLLAPLYAVWLNGLFFAGAITKARVSCRQREVVVAFVVALLLIGTYSLQTRHKTILYPLYYFVVAIGYVAATPASRRVGLACSSGLLLLQLALLAR